VSWQSLSSHHQIASSFFNIHCRWRSKKFRAILRPFVRHVTDAKDPLSAEERLMIGNVEWILSCLCVVFVHQKVVYKTYFKHLKWKTVSIQCTLLGCVGFRWKHSVLRFSRVVCDLVSGRFLVSVRIGFFLFYLWIFSIRPEFKSPFLIHWLADVPYAVSLRLTVTAVLAIPCVHHFVFVFFFQLKKYLTLLDFLFSFVLSSL
jgi:hypothetical protein